MNADEMTREIARAMSMRHPFWSWWDALAGAQAVMFTLTANAWGPLAADTAGERTGVRHAACCDTDLCHATRLARFPAEARGPGAQAPPRAYARDTTQDHVAQPRICDTPRVTNPDTPSNRPHGRSTGCTP